MQLLNILVVLLLLTPVLAQQRTQACAETSQCPGSSTLKCLACDDATRSAFNYFHYESLFRESNGAAGGSLQIRFNVSGVNTNEVSISYINSPSDLNGFAFYNVAGDLLAATIILTYGRPGSMNVGLSSVALSRAQMAAVLNAVDTDGGVVIKLTLGSTVVFTATAGMQGDVWRSIDVYLWNV